VLFGVGLLLSAAGAPPAVYFLMAGTGLLLVWYLFRREDLFLFAVLLPVILLLGVLRSERFNAPPNRLMTALAEDSTGVIYTGEVLRIDSSRSGRLYAVTRPERMYFRALTARPVQVWLPAGSAGPSMGDTIRCLGTVARFPLPRNPGQFDYRRYQALRGRYFQLWVRFPWEMEIRPGRRPRVQALLSRAKHRVLDILDRNLSSGSAAFAAALILGERDLVPDTLLATYSSLGIIHVMAVSGLHVGFITLVLLFLAGLIRLPGPLRTGAVILALFFYAALVDFRPSVVRASIMAGLFLVASAAQRRYDLLNILGLAALIILWCDPRQIYQLGFQLSFAAVLGIVLVTNRMTGLAERRGIRIREASAPVRWLAGSLGVSVAAFAATAPIVAYHFGMVPVWGILLNLLVVPAVGFIIICLLVMVLCAFIWAPAGALYGAVPDLTIRLLNTILRGAAGAGIGAVPVAHLPRGIVLLCYLGLLTFLLWERRGVQRACLYGSLIGANLWLVLWHPHPPTFRITFLDVGHGDAALLELPDHHNILIDTGEHSAEQNRTGEVVIPYLRTRGIRRLSVLAISHTDRDHAGGVPVILRQLPVEEFWYPAIAGTTRVVEQCKSLAREEGTSLRPVRAGFDSTLGGVHVRTFFPGTVAVDATPNNHSLVQRFTYGRSSVLFPGDIEAPAEQVLTGYREALRSDLLKVPHHGSRTSSTEGFLEYVRPRYAVISVGPRSRFGLPDAPVLRRYRAYDAQILETAREGAVIFQSDGRRWRRILWRTKD